MILIRINACWVSRHRIEKSCRESGLAAGGWEGAGSKSLVPITSRDHQCLSLTFHDSVSSGVAGNEQPELSRVRWQQLPVWIFSKPRLGLSEKSPLTPVTLERALCSLQSCYGLQNSKPLFLSIFTQCNESLCLARTLWSIPDATGLFARREHVNTKEISRNLMEHNR